MFRDMDDIFHAWLCWMGMCSALVALCFTIYVVQQTTKSVTPVQCEVKEQVR